MNKLKQIDEYTFNRNGGSKTLSRFICSDYYYCETNQRKEKSDNIVKVKSKKRLYNCNGTIHIPIR